MYTGPVTQSLGRNAMSEDSFTIRPTSGGVGAFVDGIDLAEIGHGTVAELRRALGAHGVLFFRDQSINF